jgi:protein-S-isoprenylcysteine O-methyltransferase Ste14
MKPVDEAVGSETTPSDGDVSGAAFDPRHLLVLSIVAGVGLNWVIPLAYLPESWLRVGAGVLLVLSAFGMMTWATKTMQEQGTAVPVDEPTTSIIDTGPFGVSRNPIYVGLLMLQLGVGIWANSGWLFAIALLSFIALNVGVIAKEETYLERLFGEPYVEYKSRVRRWL